MLFIFHLDCLSLLLIWGSMLFVVTFNSIVKAVYSTFKLDCPCCLAKYKIFFFKNLILKINMFYVSDCLSRLLNIRIQTVCIDLRLLSALWSGWCLSDTLPISILNFMLPLWSEIIYGWSLCFYSCHFYISLILFWIRAHKTNIYLNYIINISA